MCLSQAFLPEQLDTCPRLLRVYRTRLLGRTLPLSLGGAIAALLSSFSIALALPLLSHACCCSSRQPSLPTPTQCLLRPSLTLFSLSVAAGVDSGILLGVSAAGLVFLAEGSQLASPFSLYLLCYPAVAVAWALKWHEGQDTSIDRMIRRFGLSLEATAFQSLLEKVEQSGRSAQRPTGAVTTQPNHLRPYSDSLPQHFTDTALPFLCAPIPLQLRWMPSKWPPR